MRFRFLALLPASILIPCIAGAQKTADGFLRGGDVSEIPEVEAAGGHYSYEGKIQDPFIIMKKAGWNFVRFRVWNSPKLGYCDKAHTLEMAKRAKKAGLNFSIDFHYSDWWADPGKQVKPAAWKDLPFDKLTVALHDFTKDVIGSLVAQGTTPIMVQIGNEIRAGMLWPDGKIYKGPPQEWEHISALLKAGISAVHEVKSKRKILTMIHLDSGADNPASVWWFDSLRPYNVDFDVIGLSYYPFWHGHIDVMQSNLNDLAKRYGKDVYIAETAYPWTNGHGNHFSEILKKLEPGYSATPEGQAAFVSKVIEVLHQVPNGRGKGILYWAPAWFSTPKQDVPWDTLATFNDSGQALPAVDALGEKGSH